MNLKELSASIGLEEDEYRELIELFLQTGRADFDLLRDAFAVGDAVQVSRSAHTISGAAGNLGLMPVHETAKRIESAAMDDHMASASADVDALHGHFDRLAREIQE